MADRGVEVRAANTHRRAYPRDLLDAFAVVVTRDDVTNGKPHPEPYQLACLRLGVPAGGCVAVEDAPAGVASALAAGVGRVVGVAGTFTRQQLAEGTYVVVDGLRRLPAPLQP